MGRPVMCLQCHFAPSVVRCDLVPSLGLVYYLVPSIQSRGSVQDDDDSANSEDQNDESEARPPLDYSEYPGKDRTFRTARKCCGTALRSAAHPSRGVSRLLKEAVGAATRRSGPCPELGADWRAQNAARTEPQAEVRRGAACSVQRCSVQRSA